MWGGRRGLPSTDIEPRHAHLVHPLEIPDHIHESIEAISDLHAQSEKRLTIHQRGIERLTGLVRGPLFLYLMFSFGVAWIAINSWLPRFGHHSFDPFPFNILQGMTTFTALFIASMVLTTQSRQISLAEKRGHLDLQIILLTERKITKVIALLEELRRDLPNVKNRPDAEAQAMEVRMDPRAVADALEESIEAEVRSEESGPIAK